MTDIIVGSKVSVNDRVLLEPVSIGQTLAGDGRVELRVVHFNSDSVEVREIFKGGKCVNYNTPIDNLVLAE